MTKWGGVAVYSPASAAAEGHARNSKLLRNGREDFKENLVIVRTSCIVNTEYFMQHTKIILLCLIIALVVFIFLPHPVLAVDSGWESVTVPTSAGVISMRLIRINLSSPDLGIRSLASSSGELLNKPAPTNSLKSYVDQVGGFAGVNGSYFCPADYASCAGQAGSYYFLWYNSITGQFSNSYQNQFNHGGVIAFDNKNNYYVYTTPKDWPGKAQFETDHGGLQALIANSPMLVSGGNLVVIESMLDTKQRTVKSNRTGIGFKNGQIYLGVASGATVMDLGRAMDALGMVDALNLDGGGSSALYYNGRYGVGPGRNLPNALAFEDTNGEQSDIAPGTSYFAYDQRIRGGFNVTSGNVLGDAHDEVIAGTATGLAPQVRVMDGQGKLKSQFYAYDAKLRNGVTITACDVNDDGYDEIITGQGRGGWPILKIFAGDGTLVNSGFSVLDGKFLGGVNVACGDIDGNGTQEIVVAAGPGGGAHVMVYNAAGQAQANFFAYDKSTFRGGINLTTIDMDGDGRDEIVTGPQYGAPHIQIFKIKSGTIARLSPGFYAFNRDYRGGVSVTGVDTNGDGTKELAVGVGDNATALVKIFNIKEQLQKEFFVYATSFLGGVNVAGGDVDGDGKDELITMPRGSGGPQVKIIDVDEI